MADSGQFQIKASNPAALAKTAGYSQVVEAVGTRMIFLSGQTAVDGAGETVGAVDFPTQAVQVFRNLDTALKAVGCDAGHLVKMTVFLRDIGNLAAYREARNAFFQSVVPAAAPAVTLVEVSRLYGSDFMIEIDAIAVA